MRELHSVHVDLIDPVTATILTLERTQPLRHEISDTLVDLIHEHLRDGACVVTLRIEGVDRDVLSQGKTVSPWKSRMEMRSATGALVAAVDLETSQ